MKTNLSTLNVLIILMLTLFACGANNQSTEKKETVQNEVEESGTQVALSSVELKNNGQSEVFGRISNAGGKVVILQELPQQKPGGGWYPMTKLDTDTIGTDGSFFLSTQVQEPQLAVLALDNQHVIYLYLDGSDINVTADYLDFANYTVSGSEPSLKLKEIMEKVLQSIKQLNNDRVAAKKSLSGGEPDPEVEARYARIGETYSAHNEYLRSIIENASKTVIALFAADLMDISTEYEYLKEVEEMMKEKAPESRYTKRLSNKIAHHEKFIGKKAPNLNLPGIDGDSMQLSSLEGQVVLLDFWASWCKPCRDENPNVVRIYDKYHDDGFTIFSVSLDKARPNWVKAIEKDDLKWPYHVSELKGWRASTNQLYNVNSIPATFLIDQQGVIVARNLRGYMLEEKIAELVARQ